MKLLKINNRITGRIKTVCDFDLQSIFQEAVYTFGQFYLLLVGQFGERGLEHGIYAVRAFGEKFGERYIERIAEIRERFHGGGFVAKLNITQIALRDSRHIIAIELSILKKT